MEALGRTLANRDINLFLWINHGWRCRLMDRIMPPVTWMGSAGFAVVLPWILWVLERRTGGTVSWRMILTLLASQTAAQGLKRLVGRPRPFKALEDVLFDNPPVCRYSFPSGHTCAAFALALPLATVHPAWALPVLGTACLVGVSRIYLGFHYPTDVLAGAGIALMTHFLLIEELAAAMAALA